MVTASSLPFYFKFYLRPRFLDENKVYVALLLNNLTYLLESKSNEYRGEKLKA